MKVVALRKEINSLSTHLELALIGKLHLFSEVNNLTGRGLYIVYKGDEIIYVGKTSRSGKKRLLEMAHDYRSHTLNKKLLREKLVQDFGNSFRKFDRKMETDFIQRKIISPDNLTKAKDEVRKLIRSELQFRFYEFENPLLTSLEHFAISLLRPKYND